MAFLKVFIFVLVSVLGFTRSGYVDTLKKCSLSDKECLSEMVHDVLQNMSVSGVPELNIPPIDPIAVKDIDGSIANVMEIKMVEGTVKGAKNCVVKSLHVDVENFRASIELTCDITIKGKYVVKSTSDLIKNLLGGPVHGEGNGKIKIEQITIKIEFPFVVIKRGDDYYFKSELKNYKYTFNVHKRVSFHADNLYLGDKESSKEITKLLNENWKVIVDTFGGHFLDIAMKYMHDFLLRFFDNVPAKAYLLDDVSSLA